MTPLVPVRWRLTAWTAGFLATCLIVFGAALFLGLQFFLDANLDEQVSSQGRIAVAALDSGTGTPKLDDATLNRLQNLDSFVRILHPDGTPAQDADDTLAQIPADLALIDRAISGQTPLARGTLRDHTMVYVTLPIHDASGKVIGILQTGTSREDTEQLLRLLAIALVIAAPLMIIVAAVGGYLFAGRALRPIAEITSHAAAISESGLEARLNLPLPDDELGRLARTFDAMLARMDDAFSRQKQFTSDAAHELRTPLSLMRGQVDLALDRDRSSEEYRTLLREFDIDLTRLTRLVETLLSLTRSDRQGLLPDRSPFDLGLILEAMHDQYREAADAAGITLRVETAGHPIPVTLDQDLIIQVLVNLLDNALLHTPSGGTVTLGGARTDQAVAFFVRDTGAGIAEEHHARIFDRFYRAETSRARTSGGAGLGLAIVKAIVAAHGGTIELVSTPGAGSTFTVRFPDVEQSIQSS